MKEIYLDYNATAPLHDRAKAAMVDAMALSGNPSSIHAAGRAARAKLEAARRTIAAQIGAVDGEIVFTSGGTEANALAVRRGKAVASAASHASVLAALPEDSHIAVDSAGRIDRAALAQWLATGGVDVVSLPLANNETGVIEDVEDLAGIVRQSGALLHLDSVQAFGKIDVDFVVLGADLMSISAHKIGGPKGVGALVVRRGLDVKPMIAGGGQERGWRGGTENLIGICGFAAAVEALAERGGWAERAGGLRNNLEDRISAIAPEAVFFGRAAARLPNTSAFAVPGLDGQAQLIALDLAGIRVSTGSACSSGKVARSHVLDAMGLAPRLAEAALRVSFGWDSTAEEVDAFCSIWAAHLARACQKIA